MTIQRMNGTDLMVLTDRPAFHSAVMKVVAGAEGVRAGAIEGGPRPGGLAACLAALEARPSAILLIDAEPDPAAALLLVQEIFERYAPARVFLAGPANDPDLILKSQRAGASEFLPLPLDRRNLLDAVQRLWRRLASDGHTSGRQRGRLLTFESAKGGCGSTTLATNLAVTLAEQGGSIILVDLDLSGGDVALLLNLKPSFGVADVAQNVHRLDRELLAAMTLKHASGLHVLPSIENPERSAGLERAQIAQILNFLREQFDRVVVNTGEGTDLLSLISLNQGDLVHLVTCLDLLALRRAQWALKRIALQGIPGELIRLVINRYEKTPHILLEEAEKVLDLKVAWTVPADPRSFGEALNEGVPVVLKNRGAIGECFRAYGQKLAVAQAPRPKAVARGRFLGLLQPRGLKRPNEGGAQA
jgi:pilus assembly protein CpaE